MEALPGEKEKTVPLETIYQCLSLTMKTLPGILFLKLFCVGALAQNPVTTT